MLFATCCQFVVPQRGIIENYIDYMVFLNQNRQPLQTFPKEGCKFRSVDAAK